MTHATETGDALISRQEILCALDYLNYLDKRLEHNEDAWWEISRQVNRLQTWLERVAAKIEVTDTEVK